MVTSVWVGWNHRAVTAKKATWDDVVAEAANGGYRLISTDALWGHYKEKTQNLLIVDTRQEWEYRTGHIKGAASFPMEPTRWSRWRARRALEELLGTDKKRFIVFY
ncbi:MAG: rhodanese-like domain-containing protein [Desulfobacterales bacterium]|nr:MAG: rhodanese-like domain-containing protein [Desulfobacterales bacterium]